MPDSVKKRPGLALRRLLDKNVHTQIVSSVRVWGERELGASFALMDSILVPSGKFEIFEKFTYQGKIPPPPPPQNFTL